MRSIYKHEFDPNWIPLARSWSEIYHGSRANFRSHTMNTLFNLDERIELVDAEKISLEAKARRKKHLEDVAHASYRNLPEESDAYSVQRELKKVIKQRVDDKIDVYEGLSEIFG